MKIGDGVTPWNTLSYFPGGAAINALSVDVDLLSNAVSVVTEGISNEISARAAADAALSTRIDVVSAMGGGSGSVTSQELSVLGAEVATNSADVTSVKNRLSGVSTQVTSVANAVSVLSAVVSNHTSAIAANSADVTSLKNRVSANSAIGTDLNSAIQANSAQMTSADNAISAAVDIVSQAVSIETVNRISADNALSVRVDTVSNAVSALTSTVAVNSADLTSVKNTISVNSAVLSNLTSAIQANSAQMISADLALSNSISVLSTIVSNQGSAIIANSADFTSLQNRVSANSALVSNTQSAIAANSAQMVSADNAISNAVSVLSVQLSLQVSALSQVHSALSANVATISLNLSALSTRADIISNNLSANSVVLSNTVSAVQANSAQMVSADNAISNAVSVLSVQLSLIASALSQKISVLSTLVSNQGSAIIANSAQMTSADTALSAGIDTLLNYVSVVTNRPPVFIRFQYDTATSMVTEPTGGQIRFNNATIGSATQMAITYTDVNSINLADWIKSFDDIANKNEVGTLYLTMRTDVTKWAKIKLSPTFTDNTTFGVFDIAVLNDFLTGTIAATDELFLTFLPATNITSLNNIKNVSVDSVTDGQVLMYNASAGQWLASSVTAGSGSVTSTELSAAVAVETSNRVSADNVLSNAISVLSVQLSLAASALSQQISVLSVVVSNQGSAIIANSADVTSLKNRVSANSTILSDHTSAIAANSAQMTSADNAISNAVSVLSVQVSLIASALSQQISVLSVVVSNANSAIQANSADVTSLKNRVSANSAVVSNALSAIAANSAQMTSADNAISNAVSVLSVVVSNQGSAIAANSADVTSLKNRVSAISADFTSFKASLNNFTDVSIATPTDQQVLVYNSAAAQWVNSSIAAGTGSVTSTELSAAIASVMSVVSTIQWPAIETVGSALYSVAEADRGKIKYFTTATSIEVVMPDGLTSGFQTIIWRGSTAGPVRFSAATSYESQGSVLNAVNTAATLIHKGSNVWLAAGAFGVTSATVSALSAQVSVLQSAVNTLSQQVSAAGGFVTHVVQDSQGISATTLTDISGLSIAFATNGIYEIKAHVLYSISGTAANIRFGISSPGASNFRIQGFYNRTDGTGFFVSALGGGGFLNFRGAGSSVFLSTTSTVSVGGVVGIYMDGLAISTTAGVMKLMVATSVATTPITIIPGSFIKAYKIG